MICARTKSILLLFLWVMPIVAEFSFKITLSASEEQDPTITASVNLCSSVSFCRLVTLPIKSTEPSFITTKTLNSHLSVKGVFEYQELLLSGELQNREGIATSLNFGTEVINGQAKKCVISISVETQVLMTIFAYPFELTMSAPDTLTVHINAVLVAEQLYWKGFGLVLGNPSLFKGQQATDNLAFRSFAIDRELNYAEGSLPLKMNKAQFTFLTEHNPSKERPYLIGLVVERLNPQPYPTSLPLIRESEKLKGLLLDYSDSNKFLFVFGYFSSYILEGVSLKVKGDVKFYNEIHCTMRKLLYDRISIQTLGVITKVAFYENIKESFPIVNDEISEYKQLWMLNRRYRTIDESDFKNINIFFCAATVDGIDKQKFAHPFDWHSYQNKFFFSIASVVDGDKTLCSNERNDKIYVVIFKAEPSNAMEVL